MPVEFDPNQWTGNGNNSFFNIKRMLKNRTAKQAMADAWRWLYGKMTGTERTPETSEPSTGKPFFPQTQYGLLADPFRQKQVRNRRQEGILVGRMYFFVYDPKHKATLPYYDTFPLVFPIRYYSDGFLGINLHYLDIRNRAALFGQLMQVATNQRYNDKTRLRLSYSILQSMGNLHTPCIKRYLHSHVRSKLIFVHPSEWEKALFLPVEAFEKAPASRVWRESRRKI